MPPQLVAPHVSISSLAPTLAYHAPLGLDSVLGTFLLELLEFHTPRIRDFAKLLLMLILDLCHDLINDGCSIVVTFLYQFREVFSSVCVFVSVSRRVSRETEDNVACCKIKIIHFFVVL